MGGARKKHFCEARVKYVPKIVRLRLRLRVTENGKFKSWHCLGRGDKDIDFNMGRHKNTSRTGRKVKEASVWKNWRRQRKGTTGIANSAKSKLNIWKKAYKTVKDHNNVTGNDKKTCPFFEDIDAVLGHCPASAPTQVLDASAGGIL